MNRREALRRTAMLMGGALSAPAIVGVLNGCTAKPGIDWKPEFLSQEQGSIVSRLAEILIPATDTPGAKEVGVPGFIDKMLKDVYSKEEQQSFLDGLKSFNDRAAGELGDPFQELEADDQLSYVERVHKEDVEKYASSRYSRPPAPKPFLLTVKELTLLGYFTSEVGATQVLQYSAVPGAYNGCVPLSEAGNGRTWAT
jgi:gluconate 2-dehydrogenase gamma chain